MPPVIRDGKHEAPLSFRFVEQRGRLVDTQTKRAVRSHAMRECSTTTPASPVPNRKTTGYRLDSTDFRLPIVISKRCEQCNGLQFFDSPPSPEVGRLSPKIPTLAVAQFDPFSTTAEVPASLAVKFSRELEVITSHTLAFCSPGPVKTIVVPEAHRTPALLTSMLYMSYASLYSLRGYHSPELALGLKTAAMSHVNDQLSHSSTRTCTNVIASVVYLSLGTLVFGNANSEAGTHMSGIKSMVSQRGMESLGVYKFGQTIRKVLLLLHLVYSAIHCQPPDPLFDLPYSESPSTQVRHASPLDTLSQLKRARNCSPETLALLIDTKKLIDLLIAPSNELELGLGPLRSRMESYLPSSDPLCLSYGDWIYESCRLASLILISAISTPHAMNSSPAYLKEALMQALKHTDLGDNWGDMMGVLCFVSMVGMATSGGGGYRLLVVELGFEGEEGFGAAVRSSKRFGELMMALQRLVYRVGY